MGRAEQLDDEAVGRNEIVHVNWLACYQLHGIFFAVCFADGFHSAASCFCFFFPGKEIQNTPQLALIARAAAEVAGKIFFDFLFRGVFFFPEKGEGVHDKARVAEAALLCALIRNECAKLRGFFLQALQCRDPFAIGTGSQNRAGKDGLVLQEHRAQTAVGGLTAALDTGTALAAHKIQQQGVRGHIDRHLGAV